ncbi:hypothetical protein LCG56_26885 [Pseudomonas cannabina pv. alisalensis]|uniref:Lipoprotein n=1 Tax=Pseudomonas syringae pv. maculicola str. ES4326 TaxID=629265 RepID=A0A8T8C0S3_PSEYM|nr:MULTISPECIES: hypothetical protein [Pseudomonas syringae group]QHE96853.1 hypothetical protein PMA4326_009605 [Pseudomonas syringae pv. maculicola str. ES4326]UBY97512.1 hypothetical protein LCG56_26885 [Pseudomonas cannabina pv. alisalensis]
MRRSSLITLCIALLLSCGYASASLEPQRFTICDAPNHFYVSAGELASAKVLRETALIEWQHLVAKESRFSRSDMHASSAGFVFSAVQTNMDTGDAQIS